ncbi:MAG TPA: hypothetical protein PLK94_04525, partial [Alphaproteobacteria bacterium]|nr:hypothetical protein [Alphaproteobacteria bacterium]
MTGSHTKEKPIHYIATLPGGGVTVLQTLAKILLLEKLTGIDFLKLYSGGVIADSGSLYSLALLECMDAQKALETFIELAPDAFPKTSFFAHQTIRTRSRFTPTILHDRLDELLGDRTLESLQHGFSAGVINIEKDRSSRIAERIMVVPNLETGEKHYPEGSSGNIRLKDVIKAGSSVPNVNPPVTIEGKKGKHLDPTIDQNPALYGIELQRENPLAALGMVSFGSYTPSSEKFSDLFNELSARNFLDWIRGMIRQTYKKAEEHELIEKLLGVKVLDLCTEISKDNKDHPRFNPIDSTSKQLSRLCNS